MDKEYDLIVVGGGPAGSTLATLVAMANRRVLLLEKARFPRYQIGESLLPSTVHGICQLLGVSDEVEKAGFVRKSGGTWRWGKEESPWSFDFSDRPDLKRVGRDYAFHVERAKFDEILLRNAAKRGVDVREATSVTGLIESRGRVTGVTCEDEQGHRHKVRARYVADTSGNTSSLYTRVGKRHYSRFFQNIALFGYFEGGARLPAPCSGNIFCEAFREGWFWYIPLSDKLTSVGAVIAREHAAGLRKAPEEAMRAFIDSAPFVREMLKNATRVKEGPYSELRIRKDYSYTNARFWVPGMLLAGDAACFIDPILSTGVHLATYGAMLAARSVSTCLSRERLSRAEEARIFEEFEHRYRAEFEVTYEFLVSFYDRYKDHDSYFWEARKVLRTEERANHAFIKIVSGGATTAPEFFDDRQSLGDLALPMFDRKPIQEMTWERVAQGTLAPHVVAKSGRARAISKREEHKILEPDRPIEERPVREGGLVPSTDRLHWQDPA